MNLSYLLAFIPLVFAAFLVYHLIFKVQLPSKGIWAIVSYTIGSIIIFIVVGWLISTYLGSWMNDMLTAGTSNEWQDFVTTSEDIVQGAFGPNGSQPATPVSTNVPVLIVLTPTPISNGGGGGPAVRPPVTPPPGSGTTYVVQPNDTLYGIAGRYGTTVDAIVAANGLTSYVIYPGQTLTIP